MEAATNKMLDLPLYIAGQELRTKDKLDIHYPYDNSLVGKVAIADTPHLNQAIEKSLAKGEELNRYQRYEVLNKARDLLKERAEEFAQLICSETGLCLKETRYEVGRSQDVLQFAAIEALKDDGQIFSCDISPQGKNRKIFTVREPLDLVAAITPFNHPLNQVAHKLAPAIGIGSAVILKPSEKTPLTAIKFCELLYEAGLPSWMLSVILGPIDTIIEPLIKDDRINLVTFTGSAKIGKHISHIAGYKKLCLELGGNSPLIVLDDADIDMATTLAVQGCFRNSGQRCTAVKRLLIHQDILEEFTQGFIEKTKLFISGDPKKDSTFIGSVIDENSAIDLENRVHEAVSQGAKVIYGGKRQGAQLDPTIIADVPRNARMVTTESFGPLAPIMKIKNLEDAISLANDSDFGLSSGIVTNNMDSILQTIKALKTGTVNVNQIPGYRIECSPFGGIKDSGLGVKEGVIEAMHTMSTVKTFSLPW